VIICGGYCISNYRTAFEQFRKVNPRQRAKWLLEWHNLTAAARDDLAQITAADTSSAALAGQLAQGLSVPGSKWIC
jgi:acyl-CoA reductase-like NAD-dependent aldehyde dehydrogenase